MIMIFSSRRKATRGLLKITITPQKNCCCFCCWLGQRTCFIYDVTRQWRKRVSDRSAAPSDRGVKY